MNKTIYDELEIVAEKEHSLFLERLLEALYGEGWNKLTIYEAKLFKERCDKLFKEAKK